MQKDLNGLNKLNELTAAPFRLLRVEQTEVRTPRSDDFTGLGSRPHRQLGKFLMKFSGRKDGQFRSGGLLVGDRPFFFLDLGLQELPVCALQHLNWPFLWANGTPVSN